MTALTVHMGISLNFLRMIGIEQWCPWCIRCNAEPDAHLLFQNVLAASVRSLSLLQVSKMDSKSKQEFPKIFKNLSRRSYKKLPLRYTLLMYTLLKAKRCLFSFQYSWLKGMCRTLVGKTYSQRFFQNYHCVQCIKNVWDKWK